MSIIETILLVALCCGFASLLFMIWMPGKSLKQLPTAFTGDEMRAAEVLERHVRVLSEQIGSRSVESYGGLMEAAYYIEQQFKDAGFRVKTQQYYPGGFAKPVANIEAELLGKDEPDDILVVGAHYDSIGNACPGADDNGSGVAALLLLASRLRVFRPGITLRFVAFVNEEPPYFDTPDMGSWVYAARACEQQEEILGMIALETVGYYRKEAGSQKYPFPFSLFYPNKGNFIGVVGDLSSASMVRKIVKLLRNEQRIPTHGVAAPRWMPGISWSDHAAFWKFGFPAVMITDTAPYRNPHYHQPSDTWDTLDYSNFAALVLSLENVIKHLTR